MVGCLIIVTLAYDGCACFYASTDVLQLEAIHFRAVHAYLSIHCPEHC